MKDTPNTRPTYDGYDILAGNCIAYRFVEPATKGMNADQIREYVYTRASDLEDAPDLADLRAELVKAEEERDNAKADARTLAGLLEKRAGGRLMDLTAEEYEAVRGVI